MAGRKITQNPKRANSREKQTCRWKLFNWETPKTNWTLHERKREKEIFPLFPLSQMIVRGKRCPGKVRKHSHILPLYSQRLLTTMQIRVSEPSPRLQLGFIYEENEIPSPPFLNKINPNQRLILTLFSGFFFSLANDMNQSFLIYIEISNTFIVYYYHIPLFPWSWTCVYN